MGKTVMTVDDSASVRMMVSMTLRQAGFEVLEAVDGVDALDKLTAAGSGVALVIADLNMPRMDGLELLRRIRSHQELRFTPVVMLTTESHDAKKEMGKAAGATGWMVKPFRPDQLLGVVRRVLS